MTSSRGSAAAIRATFPASSGVAIRTVTEPAAISPRRPPGPPGSPVRPPGRTPATGPPPSARHAVSKVIVDSQQVSSHGLDRQEPVKDRAPPGGQTSPPQTARPGRPEPIDVTSLPTWLRDVTSIGLIWGQEGAR